MNSNEDKAVRTSLNMTRFIGDTGSGNNEDFYCANPLSFSQQ